MILQYRTQLCLQQRARAMGRSSSLLALLRGAAVLPRRTTLQSSKSVLKLRLRRHRYRSRPQQTLNSHDTNAMAPPMGPLTIGVVGFGNFGKFLGKKFAMQGHRVIGTSRGDYKASASAIGCEYIRNDANALMDEHPDVIILCTSIMSLTSVLDAFPTDRLAGCLVVDVLSVKKYPHDVLLRVLPSSADILCTHPMFGPESGRVSWEGLPFVYDVVRVTPERRRILDAFLGIWKKAQCKMIDMPCELHDNYAASSQFLTHTTGRMLKELQVSSTPINTKGFESLLGVVSTTCNDSFELFYGLYKYNANARQELDKMEAALRNIRSKLENAEREEERVANSKS